MYVEDLLEVFSRELEQLDMEYLLKNVPLTGLDADYIYCICRLQKKLNEYEDRISILEQQ